MVSTSESEASRHRVNVETRNTELADVAENTVIQEKNPDESSTDSNEKSDDNDVIRLAALFVIITIGKIVL